jgi:hypothetical protein
MLRRSFLLGPAIHSPAMLSAKPDPLPILRQAVILDEDNIAKLRQYVWKTEERAYRGKVGKGSLIRQQLYEVNALSGELYWRKLQQNEKDLSGIEAASETARLRRHLATYKDQLARPFDWRAERRFFDLLPNAHLVTYSGEDSIAGRPCHILTTKPRRAPALGHPLAFILESFRFKLWIDQAEFHWVRGEYEALETVQFTLHQLPLGRFSMPYSNQLVYQANMQKGSRVFFDLSRNPEGTWILNNHTIENRNSYNQLRYFDFRKFTSESQLITY